MKRILTSLIVFSALGGLSFPVYPRDNIFRVIDCRAEEKVIKRTHTPTTNLPEGTIFYENFQSVTNTAPYDLPEGWTTVATPGHDDDKWIAGTLFDYNTDKPIEGKYAILLPTAVNTFSHDTWMYSPGIELEGGKEYRIDFLVWEQNNDDAVEDLDIYLGQTRSVEGMTDKIVGISHRIPYWNKYSRHFTPDENGIYYIGFHGKSQSGTGGLMVDNVRVSDADTPYLYGEDFMDFGETDVLAHPLEQVYEIRNFGKGELNVSLQASSPELSFEGLPLTVGGSEIGSFKVKFTPAQAGDYSGSFTLATNDAVYSTYDVNVSAHVVESKVTDYIYEDFDAGGPKGWILPEGAVNGPDYGVDSSRAFYTTSIEALFYPEDDTSIGFTTNYVRMGNNPIFAFSMRITNTDFIGSDLGTSPATDVPRVSLLASKDGGLTWDLVYQESALKGNPFIPCVQFRRVDVPLPDYAGETCKFKLLFRHDDSPEQALDAPFQICVDDVEAGTPEALTFAMRHLSGTALVENSRNGQCSVEVRNIGSQSNIAQIELFDTIDGSVLGDASTPLLAHGEIGKVVFDFTLEPGYHQLQARVKGQADAVSNMFGVIACGEDTGTVAISTNDENKLVIGASLPVNFYGVYTEGQSIYSPAQLGTPNAVIEALSYVAVNQGDYLSESFQVFLGETDKTEFTGDDMIRESDIEFTKVFDGQAFIPNGTSDFIIPFSQPYYYTGKNLVVYTRKMGNEFLFGKHFLLMKTDEPVSAYISSDKTPDLYAGTDEDLKPHAVKMQPVMHVYLDKGSIGSIQGSVSCAGHPVDGALVKLAGTSYATRTQADGSFCLSNIKAGDAELHVAALGFHDKDFTLTVEENQIAYALIELQQLDVRKVSGVIKDSEGNPIEKVRIRLSGYDSFETYTDAVGAWSLDEVWSCPGSPYILTTYSPYYTSYVDKITVGDEDLVEDMQLEARTLRPYNVKAVTLEDCTIEISWKAPIPEFRHDTGNLVDAWGYNLGNADVLFGSGYAKHAVLKEISWYLSEAENGHDTFNVIILGRTDGKPDANKVLYSALNIPYADNSWNYYTLPTPVEADDFMIGISCNGFMALGVTDTNEEWPLEADMEYYAGDSYKRHISDQTHISDAPHYMLRALGDEYGEAGTSGKVGYKAPAVTYNVWRVTNTGRELAGTTADLKYLDNVPGVSCYEIEAVYPTGVSRSMASNNLSVSGVESMASDGNDMVILLSEGIIKVYTPLDVAALRVISMTGQEVASVRDVNELSVRGLEAGIYVVEAVDVNGRRRVEKLSIAQ